MKEDCVVKKFTPVVDLSVSEAVYKAAGELNLPSLIRLKPGTQVGEVRCCAYRRATARSHSLQIVERKVTKTNEPRYQVQLVPVGVPVRPRTEQQVKAAVRCVLIALDGLHGKGFVHRDVRWDNVVMRHESEGRAWVLIDLETAAQVRTPPTWYNASFPPEFDKDAPENVPWEFGHDIYQVGRMLENTPRISLSEAALAFAGHLQRERPSAKDALAHSWFGS